MDDDCTVIKVKTITVTYSSLTFGTLESVIVQICIQIFVKIHVLN